MLIASLNKAFPSFQFEVTIPYICETYCIFFFFIIIYFFIFLFHLLLFLHLFLLHLLLHLLHHLLLLHLLLLHILLLYHRLHFLVKLHGWCNKGRDVCNPVCGMVHIKEPLLLIGKSSLCGGSGFHFSLSELSLTICLTPYNRK